MSNRSKSGDFNLDEELRNKIVADEESSPLSDDHEEVSNDPYDELLSKGKSEKEKEFEAKYHINPHLKRKPEFTYNKETGVLVVTVPEEGASVLFGDNNYYYAAIGKHFVMIDIYFANAYNEVPATEIFTVEYAPEGLE